jgi:cell division septal protein FtsQ
MRKKRKRVRLRPKPFLQLFLFGVLVYGIGWSPITSVTNVRIEGAKGADRQRLQGIAEGIKGTPYLQVNNRLVESAVLDHPEVHAAEFSGNLFGSGLIRVTYREPVASLGGSPGVMLSKDGVLYPAMEAVDGLPVLDLPKGGPPTLLTLASNWEASRLANLAVESRNLASEGVVRIQVDERGVLCLNMNSGSVILGSSDNLDRKLQVLRERMATDPDELSRVEALNLTVPDSPTYVTRAKN